MGNQSRIFSRISVLVLFLGLHSAAWAGHETPPLRLMSYDELLFPPELPKSEVGWLLQRMAGELDQTAFIDFGDISDFMHVHVILKPRTSSTAPPRDDVNSVKSLPDWNLAETFAYLVHTQEYSYLRRTREYRRRDGHLLDPNNRNKILWPKTNAYGARGEIADAARFLKKPDPANKPFTIDDRNLDRRIFGQDMDKWNYVFYFFRAECPATGFEPKPDNNLLKVRVGNEQACVVLVSFYCRNHPEDRQYCDGSAEFEPYIIPVNREQQQARLQQ